MKFQNQIPIKNLGTVFQKRFRFRFRKFFGTGTGTGEPEPCRFLLTADPLRFEKIDTEVKIMNKKL